MICCENWKQGLNSLVPLIEAAFAKVSVIKRVEFIHKLLRVNTDCFKDVIRIPKVLTFVEWMYENYKTEERLELNPSIKTLLPSYQPNKEIELLKIEFLSRLKPAQVHANMGGDNNNDDNNYQSGKEYLLQKNVMPNDIINLNDIKIEKKKTVNAT